MLGQLEWKDGAALLSAVVAAGTFASGLGSLTERSRLRSRLASEVDIWSKLPAGPSKDQLQLAVERAASRLARLQEREVIKERRRVAAILFGLALVFAASAYWTVRTDGVHGLVALAIAVLAALVKVTLQGRLPRPEQESTASAGDTAPS